jgi:hypothetical protein
LNLPQFAMTANEDPDGLRETAGLRASGLAGAAPSLQPAPAACLVVSSAALDAAATVWPAVLPSFEGLTSITGLARRPRPATLMETGERRGLPGGAERPRTGAALLPFQTCERLPRFNVTACLEAPGETVLRPPASEAWMTSAPPSATVRMALPSTADTVPVRSHAPAMPSTSTSCPPAVEPRLPACASFRPLPQPEAVMVDAVPSAIAVTALAVSLRLPGMPAWEAKDSRRGAHVGQADGPAPQPVESWPGMEAYAPVPARALPPLFLLVPALAAVSERARLERAKPDRRLPPAPLAPAAARMVAPTIVGARFRPEVSAGKPFSGEPAGRPAVTLRPASFAALDFHCRPKPGVVARRLEWMAPDIALIRPRPAVRPVFDRWEDLAPPAPSSRSGFRFKKVAAMPRTVRQIADSKRTRHTIGAIAAGLFLGAAIWFLFEEGSGRIAREPASEVASNETFPAPAPAGREPSGGMARLRHAIAERAAVSWSDTFRGGMEAWGAGAKSWAPGWTRSADGYVQPGPLAIFHPTVDYTDYTLEFFAQIERQSIDWVVRARDAENYYAMKVTVVNPGLRPIVALAHYSVVNGQRTGYSATPLDIMVHNSRPMQVQVDVRGKQFTASVDGEQVGSWSDDAPATGGVGFFAEAGEKSRLYWMRVSRNQDFLGRICAYVTGSPSAQTAGLWPREPGRRPGRDGPGTPVEPTEALGVAAVIALRRFRVRGRAVYADPYFVERRIETWSP